MESGFPGQHTTTTTVTTNTTSVDTQLRFDKSYLRTIPGILKCLHIILDLLGFICIESSGKYSFNSQGQFFNFVAMTGFWFTLILLAFYLFHVVEKFYKIPWLKIEFVYCAIWTLFYLIAACMGATFGLAAYEAAAFFGFCAMVAYGADAYFKFRAIKSGQLAQGERIVEKQTNSVTSPAY